jgi:coenzyme F420 hydrogenase subunit beta
MLSENKSNKMGKKEQILDKLMAIKAEGGCHRCGTCVGVCPSAALGIDSDCYPQIKDRSACIGCGKCLKVCPSSDFDCNAFTQKKHEYDFNLTHGFFDSAILAHATNKVIRETGSSGGFVTQILLSLLNSGEIDGALVVGNRENEEQIWSGKPQIARTADQIIAAAQSKYTIASTNSVLSEIIKVDGRYAAVGLPCQIQGIKKAISLDKRLAERIVLTIGLFCHSTLTPEAYKSVWDILKIDEAHRFIPRLGKHPGTPYLEMINGEKKPLYFPEKKGFRPNSTEMLNVLFRLYTQQRCFLCHDALSEFADISVGDPYLPEPQGVSLKDGWSFALIRSELGRKALDLSLQRGDIVIKELSQAEALKCNAVMIREKKDRAYYQIRKNRSVGKFSPIYTQSETDIPCLNRTQKIKVKLNLLSHWFCVRPAGRDRALRFFLGNVGYQFLKLNHYRKTFVKKFKR